MSSPEILVLSNSATEKEQTPAWLAGTEPDATAVMFILYFCRLCITFILSLLSPYFLRLDSVYIVSLRLSLSSHLPRNVNSMVEIYRNKSSTTLFTLPPSFVFWLHSAFTVSEDYIFHI